MDTSQFYGSRKRAAVISSSSSEENISMSDGDMSDYEYILSETGSSSSLENGFNENINNDDIENESNEDSDIE